MAKIVQDCESATQERYREAAKSVQAVLCCPADYDSKFLKAIPQEVIDKDYGCGDPSAYLREGETVLDLGSGGGKMCYIAAQKVGPKGRVIGVDMNDAMLALAERHREEVARAIGYSNVEFRKGRIQDLKLPLSEWEQALAESPVRSFADWQRAEQLAERLRAKRPLVGDASVDVVVSNCVLNLVREEQKPAMFKEIFRVLKKGGRAVISDVVSTKEVPAHLKADPELWSGCVSGALTESGFLKAFEEAGFHGIRILKRDEKPWQVVEGIEFRSLTVETHKSGPDTAEAISVEPRQAVFLEAKGLDYRQTPKTSTACGPPSCC